MRFLKYFIRRVLETIPVLLVITILVFFMLHLVPGDPAQIILGVRATPDALANLRQQLGLDQPLAVQYLRFMQNLAHLNLGTSIFYHEPVKDLIHDRLGVTLWLIVYTAVLSVLITVPLALYSALRHRHLGDEIVRVGGLIAMTSPSFWVAILLMLLFSIRLRMLPVGGYGTSFWDNLKDLFLPALTLSFGMIALLVRSLRSSLVDVLKTDYVAFARVKGVSESKILFEHVLRSSLLSTVTLLGVNIAWLVGGTLVVEKVFALPGIGILMVDSISARDYPVVQGITLVFAVMVVLINLLTDLSYSLLDPRVSLD
jgi:peptide/nickel transport system permease protein